MGEESEHVLATCRQMRRFVTWWGDAGFIEMERGFGIDRSIPWDGELGVIATATKVIDVLTPPRHAATAPRRLKITVTTTTAAAPPKSPMRAPASHATLAAGGDRTGRFDVELLPARNGDCLWLTYGPHDAVNHVLVDCGSVEAATFARERVVGVPSVELFVLTHIDADHISGAIPLFEDQDASARFQDVWFNGWDQLRGFLSVAQGEAFSALLDRPDRPFRWNGVEPGDDPVPPVVTDGVAHPDTVSRAGCASPCCPRPRGGSSDLPRTGVRRCWNSIRSGRCSARGAPAPARAARFARPRGARRERPDEGHEHPEPEQHRRARRVRRTCRAPHRRRPRRRARRIDQDAAGSARSRG